ncbi:MAG: response regulator [Cyanobacteria bacterium P01_G01_bin.19]
MKTILIVDDSEIQLKLVTGFLKSDERKIITARNGIEGLNQAIAFKPDLIITDLVMPGLIGLELCRRLKKDERLKQIPIVVCSSKNRDIDKKWSFKQGAFAYLVKPLSKEVINLAIEKYLSQSIAV